jgi:hypothetical protein
VTADALQPGAAPGTAPCLLAEATCCIVLQ